MHRIKLYPYLFSVLFLAASLGQNAIAKPSDPDPERYADEVNQMRAEFLANPKPNAVVCVGSSSMRMWSERMERDLAPLTVIPRGFGGSQMSDVNYFFEELIGVCNPRAIMLYEGDNDTAVKKTKEQILGDFQTFRNKVRNLNPEIRVYIISVKPASSRWDIWPFVCEVNESIREFCESDPLYTYIDMAEALLDASGQVRPELYLEDGVHMRTEGYDLWAEAIRSVMVPVEQSFEQ